MSHSKVKIWVHAILRTKFSVPYIVSDIEKGILQSIKDEFIKKECNVISINCIEDHVHVLFMLNQKYSIAEVMKQVKGASSKKIQDKLLPDGFKWQVGYGAFSVSQGQVKNVQQYIKNQKIHHHPTNSFVGNTNESMGHTNESMAKNTYDSIGDIKSIGDNKSMSIDTSIYDNNNSNSFMNFEDMSHDSNNEFIIVLPQEYY